LPYLVGSPPLLLNCGDESRLSKISRVVVTKVEQPVESKTLEQRREPGLAGVHLDHHSLRLRRTAKNLSRGRQHPPEVQAARTSDSERLAT
jgi:hypothetical protein